MVIAEAEENVNNDTVSSSLIRVPSCLVSHVVHFQPDVNNCLDDWVLLHVRLYMNS